ncbi:MAG TPA: murein L,D-transpeptidase catalytic domain family protein [Longimicrobiales bacterium]|nr:murein L,D-transpeptidase catalytic domain family protein [Longimicrobiales bacterium]
MPKMPSSALLGASVVVLPVLLLAGAGSGMQPATGPLTGPALIPAPPAIGTPAAVSAVSVPGVVIPAAAPAPVTPVRGVVIPAAVPARTVDAVHAATEAALEALSSRVGRTSSDDALYHAFEAYYRYRDENSDKVRKPYFYFVDLGLNNGTPRGWVFDMDALRIVDGPFTVAHGRGSSQGRNGVPTKFSNRPGSYASSLGLYLAQETYTFRSSSYSSVGLRMKGESGEFNDAARARGIVAHGAPYVTRSDAGRSEGCPAMEMERARRLLPMLSNGGVVFIYSPRDPRWLESDPWLQGDD